MKRSNRLYLNDILESIEKIKRYIDGLSFEEFMASDMIFDAVAQTNILKTKRSVSDKRKVSALSANGSCYITKVWHFYPMARRR